MCAYSSAHILDLSIRRISCYIYAIESPIFMTAAGRQPKQGGREGIHREDAVQRQGGSRLWPRRFAQYGERRFQGLEGRNIWLSTICCCQLLSMRSCPAQRPTGCPHMARSMSRQLSISPHLSLLGDADSR